jgi:hypothetical protein
MLLKQPARYREIWRVVLDYPLLETIVSLAGRCRLVAHEQDTFAFAAARTATALGLEKPAMLKTGEPVEAAVLNALSELR